MKVLIVHPMFHVYGGAELAIVKLVEYLKSKNHTVDLLTCVTIPEVKESLKVDRVIYAIDFNDMQKLLSDIVVGYDVVNYHNHPAEVLLGTPYPSVWIMNEPSELALEGKPLPQAEVDIVKNNISKIAVSDVYNQARVKQLYDREATVIPYGVDCEFFSGGVADKWKFNCEGNFVISHVGWMHYRKNQLKTLEVFNSLKYDIPDAKLLFIGKITNYIGEMVKYIRENNLQDRVIIEEFSDRKYIRDLYKSSDVIMHPVKDQGGWLVPLEAACAGTPVIVSREAVFAKYFEENNLAVVTDDYKTVILDVYKHPSEYMRKAGLAKKFISENLSWEAYSSSVEKLLKEARK